VKVSEDPHCVTTDCRSRSVCVCVGGGGYKEAIFAVSSRSSRSSRIRKAI
jgi:hypothetical protein